MIVLDTHALIWLDRDDPMMGPRSRALVLEAWHTSEVAASAVSFWECAMLAQRGRIRLPCDIDTWRADLILAGLLEIPIDGRIALAACSLDGLHRDPADRFITATALHRSATLVTADTRLPDWRGSLPRQDARK